MSATYEEAEQVRDLIADELLDGKHVISVGLRAAGGGYSVGVTTVKPVKLPKLPPHLAHVSVEVSDGGGPARAH